MHYNTFLAKPVESRTYIKLQNLIDILILRILGCHIVFLRPAAESGENEHLRVNLAHEFALEQEETPKLKRLVSWTRPKLARL